MKIAFRVDASRHMATGHVMRCRVLADALRQRGAEILFVCRAHPANMVDALRADGFRVTVLPAPEVPALQYSPWLGVSQETDANETIAAIAEECPEWLLVDHYGLDREWEHRVYPYVGRVMIIDDLANRDHQGTILLDQNYFAHPEARYSERVPADCSLFLGPRYALLHPDYEDQRPNVVPRAGEVKRILLFVGGTDNSDLTGRLLGVMSDAEFSHLELDVVIGAAYAHKAALLTRLTARPSTRLHEAIPSLAYLMAKADLAIGAGGTTIWERLSLGLPALVVSLAPNQKAVCDALSEAGFIDYAGPIGALTDCDLKSRLTRILTNESARAAQSLAGLQLVDGLGRKRIAEVLMPSKSSDLTLRPAEPKDMLTYFQWVNDQDVRQSAINSAAIPLPPHAEWFEKRLRSPLSHLFVLEARGLPVGQVRFDEREDGVWIDYSLDRLVRGRGWARHLLLAGLQALENRELSLRALVKNSNQASLAVFRGLRFKEVELPEQAMTAFERHQVERLTQDD